MEQILSHVCSSCKATRSLQTQLRRGGSKPPSDSGHTKLLKGVYEQLPVEERVSYRKLGSLFDENHQPAIRRDKRSNTVKLDRSILDQSSLNPEETKAERRMRRRNTALPTQEKSKPRDSTEGLSNQYYKCDETSSVVSQSDTLSLVELPEERVALGFPFSLYISGLKEANDATMLHQFNIAAVLSLGRGNDPSHSSYIKYLNLPLETDSTSVTSVLSAGVRFIRTHLPSGNVLVSCYHGYSRSCAVVIAFLVEIFQYELANAIIAVEFARGNLEISGHLMSELEAYAVKSLNK